MENPPAIRPGGSRRAFIKTAFAGAASAAAGWNSAFSQEPGARPPAAQAVRVELPRGRVPVGLIIDDSTCLVNLNRFAMPQFNTAWSGANPTYHRDWKSWPVEIPDAFVRRFGEWCAAEGVKGKYSIVPYPACVGRLDREMPGWTRQEVRGSLDLVRELMVPHWDIHPEMITHTRVIDLSTGHPHADPSLKFMENWEWTTGRSADEIAAYMAYGLNILKNVGLPCEGVTTPGGFGGRALPQLARATLESVRDVYRAEIPHYFRHLYDRGETSVAPRVEYASGLDGDDPRCVVSIIGCTGDWTGGWDNTPPAGVDRFITADLSRGRMVEVIERGEPALMLAHWTGFYWNGEEHGFNVFKEAVKRLKGRFDNLIWMKLSEVARYWAAKELTRIEAEPTGASYRLSAPYACPSFTLSVPLVPQARPSLQALNGPPAFLERAARRLDLRPGFWLPDGEAALVCFDLPKGISRMEWS